MKETIAAALALAAFAAAGPSAARAQGDMVVTYTVDVTENPGMTQDRYVAPLTKVFSEKCAACHAWDRPLAQCTTEAFVASVDELHPPKPSEITTARARNDAKWHRIFAADRGPDTIDVSRYPEEQREGYRLFSKKCSKCHTLARPINSLYALPEEWSAYVDKMRRKKGSRIGDAARRIIAGFLIYDSSVRKKALIARKMATGAPASDIRFERDAGAVESAIDLLPELIAQLSSPDPRQRALAADELGQLGRAAGGASHALRRALADADRGVRASAALALSGIGLTPEIRADLRRASLDLDEEVRFDARAALLRAGHAQNGPIAEPRKSGDP